MPMLEDAPQQQEEETRVDRDGHQRPRRPNADTLSYLRSLGLVDPHVIATTEQEIQQFLQDENIEYPASLMAALTCIDEISKEVASLAGDEFGAEFLETLARITVPYSELAARKLLWACSGYLWHLATHRYGSHMLQTLLDLSVSSKTGDQNVDLARHNDAPPSDRNQDDALPSLTDLIVSFHEELLPHASELAVHLCGTHVLRSLGCVLGGVQLVPSFDTLRHGKVKPKKKKKKKHKPSADSSDSSSPHQLYNMSYQDHLRVDPGSFRTSLAQLVTAISGSTVAAPGDLQQLSCHSSGGPLLMVLLRVLTYSDAETKNEWQPRLQQLDEAANKERADRHLGRLRPEPRFRSNSTAHAFAERLLCFQADKEEQPWMGDVIYGLSGEPRGSHVLETLLRLCPDELYASILKHGQFAEEASMKEYVEHDVSNFVVQTLLATVRISGQAEEVMAVLVPLVSNGFLLNPRKKRRGVLWRLTEMVSKFPHLQERLLRSLRAGFGSLEDRTDVSDNELSSKLVDLQKPQGHGDRLVLDVGGSRSLYNILQFETRHLKGVLNGICELPVDELELIAKDGLGSRCIIDGILERSGSEKLFKKATKQLSTKLQGRYVALSVDRVGHHAVIKIFWSLNDPKSREVLVQELVEGKSRLAGNAMGRRVVDDLLVNDYVTNGSEHFHRTIDKQLQRQEWLQDMLGEDDPEASRPAKRSAPVSDPERESKRSAVDTR